ncbi:MAG: SEC-C metal-binding domain-containing protein [Kiritimatiellia bacterium]
MTMYPCVGDIGRNDPCPCGSALPQGSGNRPAGRRDDS